MQDNPPVGPPPPVQPWHEPLTPLRPGLIPQGQTLYPYQVQLNQAPPIQEVPNPVPLAGPGTTDVHALNASNRNVRKPKLHYILLHLWSIRLRLKYMYQ